MQIREIMDLIIRDAKKNGGSTGRIALMELHPELSEAQICEAILELERLGKAIVQYGDNRPIFFDLRDR